MSRIILTLLGCAFFSGAGSFDAEIKQKMQCRIANRHKENVIKNTDRHENLNALSQLANSD